MKKTCQSQDVTPPSSEIGSATLLETFYTNDISVEMVLVDIAADHVWTQVELNHDIEILLRHRMRTLKDLRMMTCESWKEITELLPLFYILIQKPITGKSYFFVFKYFIKQKMSSRDALKVKLI